MTKTIARLAAIATVILALAAPQIASAQTVPSSLAKLAQCLRWPPPGAPFWH